MFLLRTGIQGWKILLERDVLSHLQVFSTKYIWTHSTLQNIVKI